MMAQDGKAHVAYYDQERSISYIWDGGERIEVCPGGYGERVVARLKANYAMVTSPTPEVALSEFTQFIRSEHNPFNIDLDHYEQGCE